jgi:hypothetical protein
MPAGRASDRIGRASQRGVVPPEPENAMLTITATLAMIDPIALAVALVLGSVALVCALAFWIALMVIRVVIFGIKLPFKFAYRQLLDRPRQAVSVAIGDQVRCVNRSCRCVNPGVAQFCRRCGLQLRARPQPAHPSSAPWAGRTA